MLAEQKTPTRERDTRVMSGWIMLPITILLFAATPFLIYYSFVYGTTDAAGKALPEWWLFGGGLVALAVAIFSCVGYFALQPNEARVLILFGDYRGTTKQRGFCWGNPFYSNGPAGSQTSSGTWWTQRNRGNSESAQAQAARGLKRYKVSLRARTLNGDKLKVNDKRGNPVDIAAVVVWRVEDTAKAVFDVQDFETYVATQSETAVRHLASAYPYDSGETFADTEDEITLRGNVDEVSEALRVELGERLAQAGVTVEQAAPHPSRLRPRDRPGHAAPPAGRSGDRRSAQDRDRRREHGGDGAARPHRKARRRLRRRAQGQHDQQLDGGALRREPGHTGGQHWNPLSVSGYGRYAEGRSVNPNAAAAG